MTEFTIEFMFGVLYKTHKNVEVISNTICDQGRWSTDYELIFKMDEKFYRTYYSRGSTECQDEGPWEYGDPEVKEVFPKQKTITVYE